jgi:hypothetical protein
VANRMDRSVASGRIIPTRASVRVAPTAMSVRIVPSRRVLVASPLFARKLSDTGLGSDRDLK